MTFLSVRFFLTKYWLSLSVKILQFQYGNPDTLCSPLVEAKNAGNDLVVFMSFFSAHTFICLQSFLFPHKNGGNLLHFRKIGWARGDEHF